MTNQTDAPLIAPCGGTLIDLLVPTEERAEVMADANRLPSLQISERAVCDLELLATGAFSPLDRFMGRADYERVLAEMRLANEQLFPLPITLPVAPNDALRLDQDIALCNANNELLAVLTHLSKGLGFSKEDRDANILRIGFVAAEIARHGDIVIGAAVSPYRATRNEVRQMVGSDRFIAIFVDTPLDVCESRDVKGMYAKARRGEIKQFTGIDDPYEAPLTPEITLDTVTQTAEENARRLLALLMEQGYVRAEESSLCATA